MENLGGRGLIPSRERIHIAPNGKRNIIFKSALKRGYVSFQEGIYIYIAQYHLYNSNLLTH